MLIPACFYIINDFLFMYEVRCKNLELYEGLITPVWGMPYSLAKLMKVSNPFESAGSWDVAAGLCMDVHGLLVD